MERQKGPWSCWVGLPRPMYHSIIQESDRHTYQHAHIPYQFGAVHKVRHAIFGQFYPPPLSHFVTHPGTTTPESTSHISAPPIFRRPSTKTRTKAPLCKFCLNCSRGFLSGGLCQWVFCLEGFVRGGICPSSFCQNTSVTSES